MEPIPPAQAAIPQNHGANFTVAGDFVNIRASIPGVRIIDGRKVTDRPVPKCEYRDHCAGVSTEVRSLGGYA